MDLLATEVKSILDPGSSVGTTGLTTGYSNPVADLESRPLMNRGEDGEYEDTRGKDNR